MSKDTYTVQVHGMWSGKCERRHSNLDSLVPCESVYAACRKEVLRCVGTVEDLHENRNSGGNIFDAIDSEERPVLRLSN